MALYLEIQYPMVGDGSNPDDELLHEGWDHIREAIRIGTLVEVEPTGRVCLVHYGFSPGRKDHNQCAHYGPARNPCKWLDVVRVSKEDG